MLDIHTAPRVQGDVQMEKRLIPYEAATSIGKGNVLVLAPHPDDEVFGCGGAILRQIAEGGCVQVVIATDGAFQGNAQTSLEYGNTRREESRKAGAELGYGSPVFWGLEDRGLEYGEDLVQRIVGAIAAFAADYVYAPSLHEMHPDHRVLGMAALEAVRRTPTSQLVMYEVGVPMLRPNLLLDISALMPRKEAAMACFTSQLQGQAYDLQIRALNQFRSYTLGPSVAFAEAYRVVDTGELVAGPFELYESEYQRQRSLGLPVATSDIPQVSVIIRCKDGAGLQRSLDSVALQTYPNVEVVTVPTVETTMAPLGTVCGRYPLTLLNPTTPLTQASASNLGLETARGQYFILLDEGDTFLANHLEKLTRAVTAGTEMAAYTGVAVQGPDGCHIATLDEPWSIARLRGENYLASTAVLFHRSLVEKGCHFRGEFAQLADWDFWLQMATLTPFLHIPDVSAIVLKAAPPPEFDHGFSTRNPDRDVFYGFWSSHVQPHEWSQTFSWFERSLEQTQSAVAQLRKENAQLNEALADAGHRLNDVTQQLEASQARCTETDSRFHQLQSQTESWKRTAEAEKTQILRSTSWRMTAPLRYLARLFLRR
ncbi:MAG: PIG-L family deacetylase [Rhodoferax sp.]